MSPLINSNLRFVFQISSHFSKFKVSLLSSSYMKAPLRSKIILYSFLIFFFF